jgi:hypothetical protein
MEEKEEYGIVANVIFDRILRSNAKVYLIRWHGDMERVLVKGVSKSGRVIEKYVSFKKLNNFRVKWFPLYLRENKSPYVFSKTEAIKKASEFQKSFNPLKNRLDSIISYRII